MARAKTPDEWLQVYATKPLPRGVYVALRRLGPSTSKSIGYIYSPTPGMLQAVKMGFAEIVEKNEHEASAYRRTSAGDTFFPAGRPHDTYEQHVREQQAKAARVDRLARGES